jgi:pimeloyl-ACP methyl ester carboxylesterase
MTKNFLTLPDRQLAYQCLNRDPSRKNIVSNGNVKTPAGIVFLGGYASDMTGTKASFLASRCEAEGIAFLRFDYRGHGKSSGDFKECAIGDWFLDACAVIDALTEGPQIIVGSSMGGWLGLMLAMQKPERVHALIGIAAAPDFTEDLMWLTLSADQREQLLRDGLIYDELAPPDFRIPTTLKLIEEGRKHLLLRAKIPLQCPVRLLQGLDDRDVPWQHALRIVENIDHDDVRVTFVKEGDHRLSRDQDLDLLWRTIGEFV